MNNSCFWILGRGAAIANGLDWAVPKDWYDDLTSGQITRDDLITKIRRTLNCELNREAVHGKAYRSLIAKLSQSTSDGWYHRLLTTNWDTLLERELFPAIKVAGVVPPWLGMQSHVFHLNGSIEEGASERRSPFLLEIDAADERVGTIEANKAFGELLWSKCVILAGMSFACATDQAFLAALNRVQDDVPLGEASIYIVNPDQSALDEVSTHVRGALPASKIMPIEKGFEAFIEGGLHELGSVVLMGKKPGLWGQRHET